MLSVSPNQIATVASALQQAGWSYCPAFLPPAQVAQLRADLLARRDAFAPAGIGRGNARRQRGDQRSDATLWLDGDSSAQRDFFALAETVREQLNRTLFLGLADFEAHYAHYAPGQFYRRHVDAFRQRQPVHAAQRVVSAVFYLNDDWRADIDANANANAGGELVLWRDQEVLARIAPLGGSAVFFLSAEFPHEVLPAVRDRYSIAAWFRSRGL